MPRAICAGAIVVAVAGVPAAPQRSASGRPWQALPVGDRTLVPWSQADDELGVAVLDTQVCFSSEGSVESVVAYTMAARDGAGDGPPVRLPSFLVVRPAPSRGTRWTVVERAEVRQTIGTAPIRVAFRKPLHVVAGDCLAWHYGAEGAPARVTFAGADPSRPPWGGEAGNLVTALASAQEPPVPGDVLDFGRFFRRRYSIQADFRPVEGGFLVEAQTLLAYGTKGAALFDQVPVEAAETDTRFRPLCWGSSQPASFCCTPAGLGQPLCWQGLALYRICCSEGFVGEVAFDPTTAGRVQVASTAGYAPAARRRAAASAQASSAPPGAVGEGRPVTVDLFVRTFSGKLHELMHLLRSVELFWPAEWGVIVALDGGSPKDEAACGTLPEYVRCLLVPSPPFMERFDIRFGMLDPNGYMGGKARSIGLVWKEWSECYADRYSTADFVAIVDSDVVFTTAGVQQLLFPEDPATGRRDRPVIWGHADDFQFGGTVNHMYFTGPMADFMDSFPLTIRREHFAGLRDRIVKLCAEPAPQWAIDANMTGEAFDWAFVAYIRAVDKAARLVSPNGECASFHSMMGIYLWNMHRESYHWSIRHGHLHQVPLRFTCPRLRVAQHLPYWGVEKWESFTDYAVSMAKSGSRPVGLSEIGYDAHASALILAGLCALPWGATPKPLKPLVGADGRRRALIVEANSSAWMPPGEGLRDLRDETCTAGFALTSVRALPEERLLTHKFPGFRWTMTEAPYCGALRPDRLLLEYRRLIAGFVFAP